MISTTIFLFGLILVGIATVGRLWCSIYISGYKNKALITEGPYSLSRNPLYFFSLIGAVGLGLSTESLTLALVITVAFAFTYPGVIRAEEERLAKVHGEAFEAYRGTVSRFFPRFTSLHEPESYVVNPKVLRRRLFDSLWFVWGVGALEVIEGLHECHLLPILFRLY